MNRKNLLERVIKLHELYHDGKIPTLAEHEVNPGLDKKSRENYLYFTLPPCLNFQRQSPAMWRAALATWNDSKTQYLFFPEKTVKKPLEQVRKDLLKHKLSLQPNKHTEIWTRISRTLNEHFDNDPRTLLKSRGYDVTRILPLIQSEQKALFPYLSGPKMANYWLYILSRYTDAPFTNMNAISIIPDTHVLQCSLKLGISCEKDDTLAVAELWKELLEGTKLTPVDMHPVLWNWRRNDFNPSV